MNRLLKSTYGCSMSVGYKPLVLNISSTVTIHKRYTHSSEQLSFIRGPRDIPLRNVTIGKLLQEQTEKTPNRVAVVFKLNNIRKTFTQLLQDSDELAAGLVNLGLSKGDRIGIWGRNRYEWIIAQYAAARAGFILVTINPMYKSNELQYAMKLVQCKAIICDDVLKGQQSYDILCEMLPELQNKDSILHHSHVLPDLRFIVMISEKKYIGALSFKEVLDGASTKTIRDISDSQKNIHCAEPVNIQFTSGTTGNPKGATLSHHGIVNNSYFLGLRLGFHENETRLCVPVPLFHCFGMVMASLQIPNHGVTCVFPNAEFDAELTLKAISEEKCTALYGVPTMYIDMLNHPDFTKYNVSTLSTGIMAGAPCPMKTMQQAIDKMHMKHITVSYGATESSPTTFQSHRDESIEKRVSTVGRVYPHVEAKVVNEDGEIVPLGTRGELHTRGYTTMLGYWRDPKKSNHVINEDGWYKTGDIAIMEEGGYLKIVGRMNDLIIRGGENVYPLEIEQILYTHPKVKEVQVVGVPDKRLGEEICAWVQLKEGTTAFEAEIREFCRSQVAAYKVPKYIQFVTAYPMTSSGKVKKYIIRNLAIESLRLEDNTF